MAGASGGCDGSQCQGCIGPFQIGEITVSCDSNNTQHYDVVKYNMVVLFLNKVVHLNNHRNLNINVTLYRQAYAETERRHWVKEWPGQVVLCTSQIFWTFAVHEAIRAGANVGFHIVFLLFFPF